MAYDGARNGYYYDTSQPPQQASAGIFSMNVPGMTGAARTMAGMPPTTGRGFDYDQESISTNSIELHQVRHQQQQQQGQQGRGGSSDDDESDIDIFYTFGGVEKKKSRSTYDTDTMTTKSDSESNNICFRIEGSDGDRSIMSGEPLVDQEADDL